MNVLVINGSPKTDNSITLQTVLYIQKKNPEDNFTFINVATHLQAFEIDFRETVKMIYDADLILFSYPVYSGSVPANLYRFLELMKDNHLFLAAKYFTQITSSEKYMDVTAHSFVQQNCQEMKLRCIKGFSAQRTDLLTPEGQKEADDFFKYVKYCYDNDIYESPADPPKVYKGTRSFVPRKQVDRMPGKISVLTDCKESDITLRSMIDRFRAQSPYALEVYNLLEQDIKGGCTGCLKCIRNGKCVYKDSFSSLYNDFMSSNAVIFAFSIQNHFMSLHFKKYFERTFVAGCRNIKKGLPLAFIVSGPLDDEASLRMWMEAYADSQQAFLAGIATDQKQPDSELDAIVKRISYAVEHNYNASRFFYNQAYHKIHRDFMFLKQGERKSDHRYYKDNNLYDFPQKQRGERISSYVTGFLMSIPFVKKFLGPRLQERLLVPYRKVLNRVDEEKALADQKQAKEISEALFSAVQLPENMEESQDDITSSAEKKSLLAGTSPELAQNSSLTESGKENSEQGSFMAEKETSSLEDNLPSDDFFNNLSRP